MDKKKTLIIIGLFVIAAIIAFAIYKGIGASKDTTTSTLGGSTTVKTNGIGGVLGEIAAFF